MNNNTREIRKQIKLNKENHKKQIKQTNIKISK